MRNLNQFSYELLTLIVTLFCWAVIFFMASCTSSAPEKIANYSELKNRQPVEDTSAVIVHKVQERHYQHQP